MGLAMFIILIVSLIISEIKSITQTKANNNASEEAQVDEIDYYDDFETL